MGWEGTLLMMCWLIVMLTALEPVRVTGKAVQVFKGYWHTTRMCSTP